ncbi:hypothetical protein NQ317_009079 [Molorchus minor]|uniref:Uncharacterized protein n=1 Tax=Molorchus minor TaxID=1323400 RepID=A0ABQ9JE78_9CUCU|nr:hypothetical protein NQ317_009079 [Molorchus minor]
MGEVELRAKKKKKKGIKGLIQLIKVAILAGIVVAKVTLLLKIFEAAIKFKLVLIAFGGLLIHGIRLYMDLKANKKGHEETIVYKNPYEHGGDWNGPGEYNAARSIDGLDEYVQNLAYSFYKQ